MNAPLPPSTDAPVYDVDLYADDVVRDPYPHYRRIRELGSAVWLPRNGLWAIGRFADVQTGLAAHDTLVSSRGVAANDIANAMANANLLATDPPLHDHLRRIIAAPLMPRALDAVAGRIAAADYAAGDITIPAGARVLLLYASANRDERQWDAPDTFDIGRKAMGHLGFGHGVHACAGMQLARLEMRCLLAAMVARVRHLEAGEPELAMNNVLRGFSVLPMHFEAA